MIGKHMPNSGACRSRKKNLLTFPRILTIDTRTNRGSLRDAFKLENVVPFVDWADRQSKLGAVAETNF